jgi:peroxiredoxin Q/BCP
VAYFAASVDTPETNKKFAEELGLNYPILSDPGKEVAGAYGVISGNQPSPSRWTFYIGRDGKILYIDKQVNVATHGHDVLERLKALGIAR